MTAATVRGLIEAGQGGWVPRGLTGPTSDELRSLCKDAGWGFVEVRLAGVADKPDLMRTLARQLELPAYFGGNWDALEECLGDVLAGEDGMVLRLKGLGALPAGLSDPLVDIVDDLVEDHDGAGRTSPLVVVADPPLPR